MKPPPLLLLNCRQCDDILKLVDTGTRACECARSSGTLRAGVAQTEGPCRVLAIDWEQYDGAAPRQPRTWCVADERFPW